MIRLLRVIASNIATLLLALVIAVIIWGTAIRANDPQGQLSLEIPIQVIGQTANSALSNVPETVRIVVEAPGSVLDQLTENDFTAEIDLAGSPAGESTIPITIHHHIEEATIAFQFPEQATINLEQIVTRDIPVQLDLRGEVARGYEYGAPLLEPAFIQVTGITSRVETLAEARLIVLLDNIRENVILARRPTFYDSQGNIVGVSGLSLSTEDVSVTIPVTELAGFAAKPVIVDWTGEPAPGYRLLNVTVTPDSVLVTGRPTQLDLLSRLRTEVIDINGLRESITLPVTLNLPDGVELDEVQPIVVQIEIEPILTTSVFRALPEIRGLAEALTATLDVDEVRVFLFGPLDKLDTLANDDVRVTVDLFGLGVGAYDLAPEVNVLVNDIEIRSVQPAEITVVITNILTPTLPLTNTLVLRTIGAKTLGHNSSRPEHPLLPPLFALLPTRRSCL